MYAKLPTAGRAMASGFARKKILDMEREAYEKGATKEEAKMLRPAQGQDASLRMMEIMLSGMRELLQYVEIKCECNEYGEITDFSYQLKDKSQTGG